MKEDVYANKATLGRMVIDATKVAVHDDSDADLARLNGILVCEAFVDALAEAGCMITRIPEKPKGWQLGGNF